MVKTQVSSKGQTTIPIEFRNRWKSSRVVWITNSDGSALVRPVPDVMTLFGQAGNSPKKIAAEKLEAESAIALDGKTTAKAKS
jgi:bifunctional DNA-binding transcriptional regulator/antitoxin component of YhaV-PrlF toxin-antitoxin module